MSIRFFEITLPVRVKESDVTRPDRFSTEPPPPEEHLLTVHVEMGAGATPEDAAKWLAEKLEKLCNDYKPYEGG